MAPAQSRALLWWTSQHRCLCRTGANSGWDLPVHIALVRFPSDHTQCTPPRQDDCQPGKKRCADKSGSLYGVSRSSEENINAGTKQRAFSLQPLVIAAFQTPTYVQADISMPSGCYGQPKISKLSYRAEPCHTIHTNNTWRFYYQELYVRRQEVLSSLCNRGY